VSASGVHSEVGKLHNLMVHRSDLSRKRLASSAQDDLLFADVPYGFLNIINPTLSLMYEITGFRMEKYPPGEIPVEDQVPVIATAGGQAQ
jgi:hypothetical protein